MLAMKERHPIRRKIATGAISAALLAGYTSELFNLQKNNTLTAKPDGHTLIIPNIDEKFVTDHKPDLKPKDSELNKLYENIKKDGFDTVRFDLRWNLIEPTMGILDNSQIDSYGSAIKEVENAGLDDPILILSSPPLWAKELYEKDKAGFFTAFEEYVENVNAILSDSGTSKVTHVQLLNEINHPVYNFVEIEDLPKMVEIVRNGLADYNPDLKIFVTLLASNLLDATERIGYTQNIRNYMEELKTIKDCLDGVGIDYYPGTWQVDIKRWSNIGNIAMDMATASAILNPFISPVSKYRIAGWQRDDFFKDLFRDLDLLEDTVNEISTWGIEYYLTETGFPTNWPWITEDLQVEFYNIYFSELQEMFERLKVQGKPLPSKIGVYQAVDERPKGTLAWVLRILTPTPMNDWGIRKANGEPKKILQNGSLF